MALFLSILMLWDTVSCMKQGSTIHFFSSYLDGKGTTEEDGRLLNVVMLIAVVPR